MPRAHSSSWWSCRCGAVLVLSLLVLSLSCITSGLCADAPAPPVPFTVPTVSALLDLLADASASSPLSTRPQLLYFTDAAAAALAAGSDTARAHLQQLAADVPPEVAEVHTYAVPASLTERRAVDLLLNGIVTRMPALVLFHSRLHKAQLVPGTPISTLPVSTPIVYPRASTLHNATYRELRGWLMSELPGRYVDPVTYRLTPSLQFIFHPAEVRETLRVVRDAATRQDGGRSSLPSAVSLAYVRLTSHGSEETVAALSSLATQAGNSVLMLVTESAEVAAAWGLRSEHTLATAAWAAVEAAYLSGANTTGGETAVAATAAAAADVVDVSAAALPLGTMAEVVEATAASESWRRAAEACGASQRSALRTWARAAEATNSTSPLRKLDSAAHLTHELMTLQQAMKVVFVLREGDVMWFHHHLDIAIDVASRLLQTSVLYNTTTLAKNAKAASRVVRSWTPGMRIEVFWLDAEHLPDVADALHVTQVPSVLVLAPLQSRYQEVSEGEGAEEERSSQAGLRSRDPFIGVHVLNRYDLHTAAFINDATAAADPPTGKDALPLFPADSDALVRFLASDSFLSAIQLMLRPLRLSQLAAIAAAEQSSPSPSATSTLPNRRYARLDMRYYPLSAAEEPMEGPAYVRQILNGSSPLPVLTDAERQAMHQGGVEAAKPQKDSKASAAAAARKKAEWEAELARRRAEKEARRLKKAAEDAAAREAERAAFQRDVEAALQAEEAEAAAAAKAGGEQAHSGATRGGGAAATAAAARRPGALLVRRPPREAALDTAGAETAAAAAVDAAGEPEDAEDAALRLRRRRRYAEYQEWLGDRSGMVEQCVTYQDNRALSLRFKWD